MLKLKYWLFLVLLVTVTINGAEMPACKCHSKNPALRRMHEMTGFTNCDNCHTKKENLMKKAPKPITALNQLNKRYAEDSFCFPCHNPDSTIKKEIYKSSLPKISDTYFCPKDKLKFPPGTEVCPKCGGQLLNINQLMADSLKNPTNSICQQCHLLKAMQTDEAHQSLKTETLTTCLTCHKGHADCAGCHH